MLHWLKICGYSTTLISHSSSAFSNALITPPPETPRLKLQHFQRSKEDRMGAHLITGPELPGSPHRIPCPVMSYDCIELGVCCMAFKEARSNFSLNRGKRGVGRGLITWWFGALGAEALRVLISNHRGAFYQVSSWPTIPALYAPALICPS